MSKEKPSVLEKLLGAIDVMLVWKGGGPIVIMPVSERAKSLFIRWGMNPEADGIHPPPHAMDLMDSVPEDWILAMEEADRKEYKVDDIPLPQPRLVLH